MNLPFLERLIGKKPRSTAAIAKERLTVVLARERSGTSSSLSDSDNEMFLRMQEEILAVISKYYPVSQDAIKVTLEQKENVEILQVDVVLHDNR